MIVAGPKSRQPHWEKGLKEFIQQAQVLGRDRSPRLGLWSAGGVVGLTAGSAGHWRGGDTGAGSGCGSAGVVLWLTAKSAVA